MSPKSDNNSNNANTVTPEWRIGWKIFQKKNISTYTQRVLPFIATVCTFIIYCHYISKVSFFRFSFLAIVTVCLWVCVCVRVIFIRYAIEHFQPSLIFNGVIPSKFRTALTNFCTFSLFSFNFNECRNRLKIACN